MIELDLLRRFYRANLACMRHPNTPGIPYEQLCHDRTMIMGDLESFYSKVPTAGVHECRLYRWTENPASKLLEKVCIECGQVLETQTPISPWDLFAAAAIQGILAHDGIAGGNPEPGYGRILPAAQIADAMMSERAKRMGGEARQ